MILWSISITLSFFGWGALSLRLLNLRNLPVGLSGAAGVSAVIFIGGLLNLADLLTIPILSGIVMAGVIFLVAEFVARRGRFSALVRDALAIARRNPSAGTGASLALLSVAVLVLFALGLHHRVFNGDDLVAYLPLPLKTVALGALPSDPFSERRIVSSLGGNIYLQAMMLPDGDVRSIAFIDTGFGYLLLAVMAYHLAREFAWRRRQALALAALSIALPFLKINLQMSVLPAALFVASMIVVLRANNNWKAAVLLGATGAAITSLKSNYIIAFALILGIYVLMRARTENWKAGFTNALALTGAFLIVLFPWMLDARTKTGTYFYPLLGSGFHETAYPGFAELDLHPANLWTILSIAPLFVPLVVLLWLVLSEWKTPQPHRKHIACVIAFIGGSAGATVAVGYATAGDSVGRYCLPFIYPATLGLIAFLFSPYRQNAPGNARWKYGLVLTGLWVSFLVGYYGFIQVYGDYREYPADLLALFSEKVTPATGDRFVLTDREMKQYVDEALSWQARIPAGSTVLEAVGPAIGIDFLRNPVYIADWPGMAGLPPGLPFNKPAALKPYLVANHIPYVAYSDDGDYQTALKVAVQSSGRRMLTRRQDIAQAATLLAFEQLRRNSSVVYENGRICVIQVY